MTDDMTPTPQPAPRPAAPLSVRIGWGSALFQAAMVVLGVILGFAITEWQTSEGQRAEARLALAGIVEEIAANREAVASSRAYHQSKIAVVAEAQKANTPLALRAFERGFVSPAQVSSAAWTSATEIGALAHLPFGQVLSLSRVYSQQAAYMQQQATISSVIYTEIFERGTEGILDHAAGLRAILGTLYFREQQLETSYAEALAAHGGKAAP